MLHGTPILVVFIVGRIILMALTVLIQSDAVSTYVAQPFWRDIVSALALDSGSPSLKSTSRFLADIFCQVSMTSLLVPVLVWVLVTFRAGDWKVFLATPRRAT